VQKRLHELDLLRAAALVGVVLIHATAWSVGAGEAPLSSPLALLADLARSAVPLFVLASGFALRARYREVPAPGRFLGRRWRRTLVPWLCWVPVFAVLGVWDGALPASGAGLGTWLAYGGGHLYFLLLIAQLYLVFLVLPKSRRRLAAVAAAALALQLGLGWLHTYGPAPAGPLGWPLGSISYWLAPYYAGYFVLGALLADFWPQVRARTAAIALALAAGLVIWLWSTTTIPAGDATHGAYAFLWPGRALFVGALGAAVLAWGSAVRSATVAWLGSRSLGVYLVHPLFLALAGPPALALGPAARAGALALGSLAFGALAVAVLTRSRLGAQAIGEEAPMRPAGPARSVARLSLR